MSGHSWAYSSSGLTNSFTRGPLVGRVLGRSVGGHRRCVVRDADVGQGAVDVGIDHVEQRHRVEAEREQPDQQRYDGAELADARDRAVPATCGTGSGPVIVRWYIQRM